MKHIISFLLIFVLAFTGYTFAFAENELSETVAEPGDDAENETPKIILTDPSYTLSIPAAAVIPYGAELTDIGAVKITKSADFDTGDYVSVTMTYDGEMKSDDVEGGIPYTISLRNAGNELISECTSGCLLNFYYDVTATGKLYTYPDSNGSVEKRLWVNIAESAWNSAAPGTYSTTITFTSSIVE